MIDPTTDIVREYESALRRQADSTHLAAEVRHHHPAAGKAAFRNWLARGEIGRGYDWRSEQPGSGWRYVRPNAC